VAVAWIRIPAERHNTQRSSMTPLGNGPVFGYQEPCFGLGQLDNLSHAVVREIYAVDCRRKFARQPHSHLGMK